MPRMRVVPRSFTGLAIGCGWVLGLGLGPSACGSSTRNNGTPASAGTSGSAGANASGGQGTAGSVTTGGGLSGSGGSMATGGDAPAGGELNDGGATDGGAPPSSDGLTALPGEMRRLTAAEYTATVSDVLGTKTAPDLSAFSNELDGFDNNAAVNGVSDVLYLRYLETAEDLADEVFASDALRARIVTCSTADDVTCVRQVITQTGLRLFRRPLTQDELSTYATVYTAARGRSLDHAGSLKEVLKALLASAQFVYRIEPVPLEAGDRPITPYELATRLSYLLWSSAPDDELLQAAEQDALESDTQLDKEVRRLVADPRVARFTQNFAGQWLGTRQVPNLTFDPARYPSWSPQLASAAAQELAAYFEDFVKNDGNWLTFLSSPTHFVNASLGQIYGLNVQGASTQRVEIAGQDRQGFLGLVAFLAQASVPDRTSPLKRGSWIFDHLLCSPLPEMPPNIPEFAGGEESMRAYLGGLPPVCQSCHSLAAPLGLALDNYDAIGRYRTTYQSAAPIDAAATLTATPALPAAQVNGIKSLSQELAKSAAFKACTAQKLYTYGLGRAVSADERPNVDALSKNWEGGPLTMHALVSSLVRSKAFRVRSDGGNL
jgi:hypothetical protein